MGLSSSAIAATEEAARELAPQTVAKLLHECDNFLFDCDGTIYQAGVLLPHVKEAISYLKQKGKKVFYITNTSSRSAFQLMGKLQNFGLPCSLEESVPSCVFTASWVKKTHPSAARIYVIGGSGVIDEFKKLGVECHGGPADDDEKWTEEKLRSIAGEMSKLKFDGVVVGWDIGINYYKIFKAGLVFQQNPDAFFYATNADPADRVDKWLIPGNGPLLKSVEETCASCAPFRIGRPMPYGEKADSLGKPNPVYAKTIAEWNNLDPSRSIVIGDRLDTDVLMGNLARMRSGFVLTGVDDFSQIEQKGITPDFVLGGVGDIWVHRPTDPAALASSL